MREPVESVRYTTITLLVYRVILILCFGAGNGSWGVRFSALARQAHGDKHPVEARLEGRQKAQRHERGLGKTRLPINPSWKRRALTCKSGIEGYAK
jgi:hypothetical protein